jgi:hypothetical protein
MTTQRKAPRRAPAKPVSHLEAAEVKKLATTFPLLWGRVTVSAITLMASLLMAGGVWGVTAMFGNMSEIKTQHVAIGEKMAQRATDSEVVKTRLAELDRGVGELRADIRDVQRDMRELLRRLK